MTKQRKVPSLHRPPRRLNIARTKKRLEAKRPFSYQTEGPFLFVATAVYGSGVGVAWAEGFRRKVGGAGVFDAGLVESGAVVVGSSGVGWPRFSVGRPGVSSFPGAIAPALEAWALE